LEELVNERYAVIQPFAGTRERDVPPEIVNAAIEHLWKEHKIKAVLTGKSYNRENADHSIESSAPFIKSENVIDLLDRLTVPGTIVAVSNCTLFFGTHSSMNIAAWHYIKPCVVLYDEATKNRHFLRTDEWSFGKDFHNCRHGMFSDFSVEMMDRSIEEGRPLR
jgi:ADP-heptose:LPS heptosyltransferase